MHTENIARIDANLLVTLDVLLDLRNVTAAARQLGRSQPAISHALSRLRGIFDDPLLVRGSGEMVPTPLALSLAAPLRDALSALDALVAPSVFDPAESQRVFRLAVADAANLYIAPGLVARVTAVAPGARLELRPHSAGDQEALVRGELDLVVGSPLRGGPTLHREVLFEDTYAVLLPANLAMDPTELDASAYLALPHVNVGLLDSLEPTLDAALASLGVTRRVIARVPDFSGSVMTAGASGALLTAPRRLVELFAATAPTLRMAPLPFDLADFRVEMVWHARSDADPGHRWLREQLRATAAAGLVF